MARSTKPPSKHAAQLTPQQMIAGIERLKKRREEVERFDPLSVTDQHNTPALDALEAAVDETLVRTFGVDTLDYDRYKYAKDFDRGPYNYVHHVPPQEFQASIARSKASSVALLGQAIKALEEQLEENVAEPQPGLPNRPPLTDAEVRYKLLSHFYRLRDSNGGYVPVDDMIISGTEPVSRETIGRVCRQLGEAGLVEWSGYLGQNHTIGSARITGSGIDAVERGSSASIEIRFPEAPKRSFIRELEERKRSASSSPRAAQRQWSRKVFIVHGHDNEAKVEVARFLERVGFEVIILHEQANRGRTIIEKVEMHSDVGFAVVLLTPDDEGSKRGNSTRPRARQNVVLELGYFIGRLGRDRVCALKRGDVEIPSDFDGVVYETYDDHGAWKSKLAKELEAAKFVIDWPKVHA